MSRQTPLRPMHEAYVCSLAGMSPSAQPGDRPGAATGSRISSAELETIAYGPSGAEHGATSDTCQVPAMYDTVETEYGALRRGAGLMDCPHRGTLVITGAERIDFLNRMLTQQFADADAGSARQSFLINRKGRVLADLFVAAVGDRAFVDVDIHQAAETVQALDQFLFAEDVQIENATEQMHRIAVHGQNAATLIGQCAGQRDFQLDEMCCAMMQIGNIAVGIARRDQIGESGYELFVKCSDAPAVWQSLLDVADAMNGGGARMHRPVGWHAWNIARIEAGSPVMNIDFDTTSLPHETSLVDSRVSFRKGCYPGQEVIARMQNLGAPKQRLVGLRVQGDVLPVAGTEVFAEPDNAAGTIGEPVGVITSSTLSPMLGAVPIAFAMLRTKQAPDNATVVVAAEGETARASVVQLQFWSRSEAVVT